jgi:hypothetical protein
MDDSVLEKWSRAMALIEHAAEPGEADHAV